MGRPELSSFSQAYTAYAGREGLKGRRTFFFKFRLWCIANLRRGLKINILKVLLVGRGHIKNVNCVRFW